MICVSAPSTFSQGFSVSFICSQANLRQVCTCAFLSRGIQDFGVGVLSALFWETIFPPAEIGEILRGAPDGGWLTVNDILTVLIQHFSAVLEHFFPHISAFYPSTHSDSNQCIRGTWGSVSCPKTEAMDLHLLSCSHPTSGRGGSIYISSISK